MGGGLNFKAARTYSQTRREGSIGEGGGGGGGGGRRGHNQNADDLLAPAISLFLRLCFKSVGQR